MKDEVSKTESVPYIAFESELARQERTIKRLWILCLVIFLAFVASNVAWIWYENQFIDEVTITQENDNGYNNYIGNDGNISNSEPK